MTPIDPEVPGAVAREQLTEVLHAAVRVGLGEPFDPKPVWTRVAHSGPGRLSNIARVFLVSKEMTSPAPAPDHAPMGVILPHESWMAEQVAARL